MMGTGWSFLEVLQFHANLDELFPQHQEALLQLDLSRAAAKLQCYERGLHLHMQIEEELLCSFTSEHAAFAETRLLIYR